VQPVHDADIDCLDRRIIDRLVPVLLVYPDVKTLGDSTSHRLDGVHDHLDARLDRQVGIDIVIWR
jgi:hypothetical protein